MTMKVSMKQNSIAEINALFIFGNDCEFVEIYTGCTSRATVNDSESEIGNQSSKSNRVLKSMTLLLLHLAMG